ncbi:MAG: hypothetical protein A3F31_00305 [Candidatus Levybacteria bacterium RIFCSPHIGHO2_12_FULL_38_12]|nr:MAG: hypothetical protein A2770_03375 [Candidatus Levybacteria bacterium RIFCSPHIGHO2_01_FULL_38_12]OGH23201.1 MAG: hypothetical protein A3F31_00305 [Candidatus Levybacteria bacterium RIFCSPHIGHO2_12_FULL_38_12]OGH34479.1 MAG: hypothetical protein A3A47_00825 [Candidatus Levybacteria bacterium RIFCSPLOWO2_01_FULL_37_20]OGH44727.1 MAG: hypothetical protein A3J14_00185 [Candidatus Levybacteria bacterium RIFCSPLOWO2_02_FULL_37_18]
MRSVKQILKKFNPIEDKYISREFQSFGMYLAEELNDYKHRGLYIKLAKTVHRSILEKALSYVVDSKARNKGALFMWKVKELKNTANAIHSTTIKSVKK